MSSELNESLSAYRAIWFSFGASSNLLWSILSKLDLIQTHAYENKPDICESFTNVDIGDALLGVEGYELISRKDGKDKINEFLLFCDDNFPSKILLKKENEFELIDFLVKQSKKFNRVASKE